MTHSSYRVFVGNTMAERLREFNNFETRLMADTTVWEGR